MTTPNRSSQRLARLFRALLASPIFWGALGTYGFYDLVRRGVLDSPFIQRYFASHPVEYIMTAMFLVGTAALAIKALDITRQYRGLARPLLSPIPRGGQPATDCEPLAGQLERAPMGQQDSYRVRRLRDALEHVRRTGSADALDEHMKYLADLDADRLHSSYGLVRVIIWAIPILGFLGTVIGITMAIGKLAPEALETSLPTVMKALSVAFYTTIQALGLSIVLMFAQYFTNQKESALLAGVDRRVEEELAGRFERVLQGPDGQLVAVRRMMETVVQSTEQLVRRQAELWQASLDTAGKRWTAMAETAGEQLQAALAGALAENLKLHAREVVAGSRAANEENRRHWQQLQQALVESTETVAGLQQAVIRKAEVLGRAVGATDRVASLQETLNQNLRALAGARNFEQTVMSLAAVIHLLTARLGDLPADAPKVELEPEGASRKSQAA